MRWKHLVELNGDEDLRIVLRAEDNGEQHGFATQLDEGDSYTVEIIDADQVCNLIGGEGVMAGQGVSIMLHCNSLGLEVGTGNFEFVNHRGDPDKPIEVYYHAPATLNAPGMSGAAARLMFEASN